MDALVSIPGAEPWSAAGRGERRHVATVVVHGITASPVTTRPLGQRLAAEGYSVEVPLLPGHGTSFRELGRTRYPDWYRAVEELVEQLAERCEQVVMVGHSMGGTISLDLASRRPELVGALAVINPLVVAPSQPLAKVAPLLQHVVPYLPRDLAGMPTNDMVRPDGDESAYGMIPSKAMQSLLAQLPRIRSQLLDLTQPLLVVRSLVDHTVNPRSSTELLERTASRDLREVVCERSYHLPQVDLDAEKVSDAIVDFVADVTGS